MDVYELRDYLKNTEYLFPDTVWVDGGGRQPYNSTTGFDPLEVNDLFVWANWRLRHTPNSATKPIPKSRIHAGGCLLFLEQSEGINNRPIRPQGS